MIETLEQAIVEERSDMRRRILSMLLDLPQLGFDSSAVVEHGYDQEAIGHVPWLSLNPMSGSAVLVILHPAGCGCDALTDELVLHG